MKHLSRFIEKEQKSNRHSGALTLLKVRLWCDVIDSVPIYDISKQTFFTFYLSIVGKKKSGLNVLNFHVACMCMSVRIQGFI